MASPIEAGRAFMRLFIDDSQFRRGLTQAGRRLQAFGQSVTGLGAGFLKIGGLLTAPIVAAVKFASDAEETFSKFNVVFGDSADEIRKWGDELAAQVGRSEVEIAGFLAGFQDLLVPIGVDPEQARESSKVLTALAIDLASLNNQTDAEAVRRLQAALTGSSETLKDYGIIANEAAVKQELFNQGIEPKNATEAEKALARLNIFLRDSTTAQGDAARTAGGFANSMRGLFSAIKDTAAAIGGPLLGPLSRIARLAASAAKAVGEFAEENTGLIRTVSLVVGGILAIGGALVTIGPAIGLAGLSLLGISVLLGKLAAVATFVVSPIGLAIAAVTGLGVVIVRYTTAGAKAVEFLKRQFATLLGPVITAFSAVRDALGSGDVQLAAEALMAGLNATVTTGVAKIRQVWGSIEGFFVGVWYDAVAGVSLAISGLQELWIRAVGIMREAWAIFAGGVQSGWATSQAFVTQGVLRLQKYIHEALTGEEFDISVELGQAEKKLQATLRAVQQGTDQAVQNARSTAEQALADLATERQQVFEAIDNQERERRAEIATEVENAAKAAADARQRLEELAANAKAGAEAGKEGGEGIGDRFAGLLDKAAAGIKTAADRINPGTFSGRAAAAILTPTQTIDKQHLDVARKQLGVQEKIEKEIKKGGLVATP